MTQFWWFITDLGDSAVTLPLATLVLAWLAFAQRDWRAARAWAAGVVACGLAMTVLKLGFQSCGHLWLERLASPSGHTAMSAAVYGGLGLLACREAVGWRRPGLAVVFAILVVLIAASRVVLDAHTWPEVLVGLAVGAASAGLMRRLLGDGIHCLGAARLAGIAVIVALVLHGGHWPIEGHLRQIAAWVQGIVPACR